MRLATWVIAVVAGVAVSAGAGEVIGQDPAKAAVQFDASVPREKQIAMALSAAPDDVASKAAVYILGAKGYEKVREGTNGVSCLMERSFRGTELMSAAPMCYDAEGSRTLMLVTLREEELRASGKSSDEIKADIASGYKDGRFKAPGHGFLYMMSSENHVWDPRTGERGTVGPHVMFYVPYMTPKDFGYDTVTDNMVPFLVQPGEPDAMLVVMAKKPAQAAAGDSKKQ